METPPTLTQPLTLQTQYRDYVWGGDRLRPGQVTGEAWLIYEGNLVTGGLGTDAITLGEAAAFFGADLLGERPTARTGTRFPLLIKILDCAQWLSLQVHPNNQQAAELAGPGSFGKAEAWHVLQADPGAQIYAGFQPATLPETMRQSVQDGTILDYAQRVPLRTGDTVFIRPGTLHALGPGLLVYEVQQTSDLTYRVFDWNRPASDGRPLHIPESLAVLDVTSTGQPIPQPPRVDGGMTELVRCDFFSLRLLTAETAPIPLTPAGQTFHALTAIQGAVELRGAAWQHTLRPFESVIVPANCPSYTVQPLEPASLLLASVE